MIMAVTTTIFGGGVNDTEQMCNTRNQHTAVRAMAMYMKAPARQKQAGKREKVEN